MRPTTIVIATTLIVSVFAAPLHGQSTTTPAPAAATQARAADQTPVRVAPPPTPLPSWIEPVTFSGGLLDQNQRDVHGASTLAQLRAQLQMAARVRLVPGGALAVYAGGGTGGSFRSGWNHTPLGTQPGVSTLHVKHLFASVRPGRYAEVQVGSMPAYRGVGSEMTGFDNDSFQTGVRVLVKARPALWFDEIGVTRTFIGDLALPSAFDRLRRVSSPNAFQAIAARRVAAGSASVEYVDRPGVRTLGGAVQTARVPFLTSVRVEGSAAVTGDSATAFAAVADRRFGPLTASLGGSRVDPRLGTLNGDRYGAGTRVFTVAVWRPFAPVAVTFFASRSVGQVQEPRTRADIVLIYDVLRALAGRR